MTVVYICVAWPLLSVLVLSVLVAPRTRAWGRFRYLRRLAWYRVTFGRRMPRYKGKPMDGPCVLSVHERAVFCVIGWLISQRKVQAEEPNYERSDS